MDTVYEIVDQTLVLRMGSLVLELNLNQIWPVPVFTFVYFLLWKKTGFIDINTKAIQLSDKPNNDDKLYVAKDLNVPTLPVWATNVYRKALRTVIGRRFLVAMTKSQADFNIFTSISLPDSPTYFPIILPETMLKEERKNDTTKDKAIDCWKLLKPCLSNEFSFNTISAYVEAYRNGTRTPTDVAHKIIDAIVDSESMSPKMRIIIEYHASNILSQAEESTQRWKNNLPLSVFDGVPVAVKDEMFVAGYPCRSGTPLQEFSIVKSLQDEGWMVRKLREGGAMFIGMANMHQLGIGITGINPSVLIGPLRLFRFVKSCF